jgi:hypothetical protein
MKIPAIATLLFIHTLLVKGQESLWVGTTDLSNNANIPFLKAEHSMIDECEKGEFQFTLGADIVYHEGEFFTQWANSKEHENDEDSLVRGRRSSNGKTWGPREVIAPGFEGPGFHSSGVFHSQPGRLLTFNTQIHQKKTRNGIFPGLCTDAFVWKPSMKKWEPKKVTGLDGFWPLCKPARLANGKWIMAGAQNAPKTVLSAVALCDDNQLTNWRQVVIPHPSGLPPEQMWGETTVTVEGPRVLAIVRNGKKGGTGFWHSISTDNGETWPELRESNIPHGGGRPVMGRLADGRHYLVANLRTRNTLVLALSQPGSFRFDRMYRLIDKPSPAVRMPSGAKRSQWGYPSAVEHQGRLYVVYSVTKEANGLTVVDLAKTR